MAEKHSFSPVMVCRSWLPMQVVFSGWESPIFTPPISLHFSCSTLLFSLGSKLTTPSLLQSRKDSVNYVICGSSEEGLTGMIEKEIWRNVVTVFFTIWNNAPGALLAKGVTEWTNANCLIFVLNGSENNPHAAVNKLIVLIKCPLSKISILSLSVSPSLFVSLSVSLLLLPHPLSPTLSPLLTSSLLSKRWNQFFSPRRRQITPNNPSFPEEGLFLSRSAKRPAP